MSDKKIINEIAECSECGCRFAWMDKPLELDDVCRVTKDMFKKLACPECKSPKILLGVRGVD